MEHYLLNSAACLAILLLFYKLALEKEQMHQIKRGYLLVSVLAAVGIPLITMTTYVEAGALLVLTENMKSTEFSEEIIASGINWNLILWSIYGLGVSFFSIRFFLNLHSMVLRIRNNPKLKNSQFVTVLLKSDIVPHTFFRYLFFNKKSYEKHLIPSEVLMHEQTHAKELHSLDILLIELLQVVFWFNPLIYLAKNAIKLNHEFLADQAVIRNGIGASNYQKTLLAFSSNAEASNLANAFNYSSIKKRFTVMKTQTSKTSFWVRSLLMLPLMALLFYGFSTKEMVERESLDFQKHHLKETKPKGGEKSNFDSIAISEVISISILKDGSLIISNKPTNLRSLSSDIEDLAKLRFKASGKQISRVYIDTSLDTTMEIITDLKEIIRKSGISEIYISIEGKNEYSKVRMNSFNESRENDQKIATPEMIAKYNKMAAKYPPESWPALIQIREYKEMQKIYKIMTPEQKRQAKPFPKLEIIEIVEDPVKEATPERIAEYNRLVKYYNSMPKDKRIVKQVDINRMMAILSRMTPEEKAKAEKINFDVPPPPPPTPAPKADVNSESVPPPPPAPPAPPTFEKLVADGAVFHYNGKIIEPEEARNLVEVQKSVNVQITYTDEEKPIVKLNDKKDKD
jgi:biopolymer transport protein ExbD